VDVYELGGFNQTNALYRNDSDANNWLIVKTIGTAGNRDGIGTRIRVVLGELSMMREVNGGFGYGSQDSLPVEFGLGGSSKVDKIEIRWPTGKLMTLKGISANQIITVREP
jgi:hypothetical protein